MEFMSKVAALLLLLSSLSIQSTFGAGHLSLNYYSKSCPRAEAIVKEQVEKIYHMHRSSVVSWVRIVFHDCVVVSCDASILLEKTAAGLSEQDAERSFGMRSFKYLNTIKDALEKECPGTVSCADVVALSARDGVVILGGPYVPMKTGRFDSKKSYAGLVDDLIPNHNDTISYVLSRFRSIGIDTEAAVALLGAHSVGRVHCTNMVDRLYPKVDPTIHPQYAEYLKFRCNSPNPDPNAVLYARNDRETPMILDNMYYKNLLKHKGLLLVDQQLVSNPATSSYVKKMAADNNYFRSQFTRGLLLLSENNPLNSDQGEVRKDCRFVN